MTAWGQSEAPQQHQDEEARALFEAGKVAYTDGRYDDAIGYFERSYRLSQRAGLQYNLGLAYDRLRRDSEALTAFEAYLANSPDPEREQEVQNRVRALKASLAREAQVQENQGPLDQQAAPARSQPVDAESDQVRKRRLWVGVAAGVAALAVGAIVTWSVTRDDEDPRPAPNSGVTFEALSWR
jgi:tetratricopeptide (TPR) repeat protein